MQRRKSVKYYYVEVSRMKIGILTMEPVDEEVRLFSSVYLAQEWLKDRSLRLYESANGTI